jgi:hypothetical protein
VRNFCDAVRDRRQLTADALTGHLSTSLCHLGNIATRVGRSLEFDPQTEQIVGDDEANALVRREYRDHWGAPRGVLVRSVEAIAGAGAHTFFPGEWGVVGLAAVNRSSEPAKLRATVYFNENRNLQFARELWVPAGARRQSWCPLRAPEQISGITADLRTLADDLTDGTPRRLAARDPAGVEPDGGRWSNLSLPFDPAAPVTAVITSAPGGRIDGEIRQVVLAARQSRNLRPYLAGFYTDFLAPTAESLGAVRHVVVAGDRPADDPAGRAALRGWVRDGGKMWILLDRVAPETVRLLLGDLLSIQVVDRVGLTHVHVHRVSSRGESFEFEFDAPRDYDEPVELVRVLVSGDVEVLNTVNDWPAAFRVKMGRGEVLFTTLGPRGWMRPADDPRRGAGGRPSRELVANQPLMALAADFFRAPQPPSLSPAHLNPVLSEQVGYRVLGRGWVVMILGSFCLAMIGGGLWLVQRHMGEWLGWIGPAGAIAAAALLASMGLASRRSIPPTIAVLEHLAPDAAGAEVTIHGAMAAYRPEPGPLASGTLAGGIAWPDMSGLDNQIRCLVWTDLDQCRWEGLTVPAGVRFAQTRRSVRLEAPMIARAEFGPRGVSGMLSAPISGRSDGVLIGPSGETMAVTFEDDGRFRADAGSELAPGKFIAADLLTDQQRRRQHLGERVFPRAALPPAQPRLALWSDPLEGIETSAAARVTGAEFINLPLQFERLPPGARAVIPSPLVAYRSVPAPEQHHAGAYNNSSRRWVGMQFPADTWLRFQLPAETLPFEPQSATLRIRIDAPGRLVEVRGRTAEGARPLAEWHSPHGTLRYTIEDAEVLQLDAQGGLLLGIHVGADGPASPAEAEIGVRPGQEWVIESVALEVSGASAEPP